MSSKDYQSMDILRSILIIRRSSAMLSDLKLLISPAKSYASYRHHIKLLNPPCIPYIGLFLSDLIFISEMPDKDEENEKSINFNKNVMIGSVISKFCRTKEIKHNYIPVQCIMVFL